MHLLKGNHLATYGEIDVQVGLSRNEVSSKINCNLFRSSNEGTLSENAIHCTMWHPVLMNGITTACRFVAKSRSV